VYVALEGLGLRLEGYLDRQTGQERDDVQPDAVGHGARRVEQGVIIEEIERPDDQERREEQEQGERMHQLGPPGYLGGSEDERGVEQVEQDLRRRGFSGLEDPLQGLEQAEAASEVYDLYAEAVEHGLSSPGLRSRSGAFPFYFRVAFSKKQP
jgi:hypothetical protein